MNGTFGFELDVTELSVADRALFKVHPAPAPPLSPPRPCCRPGPRRASVRFLIDARHPPSTPTRR